MASVLPLCLLVLTACALALVDGSTILLKPTKEGSTEKLLTIIIGARVPAKEYVSLAAEIQKQSPFKLWVAIPEWLFDVPEPIDIKSRITETISAARKAGFTSIGLQDVFLAGHSLGGIFGRQVASSMGLAGLILLGSYTARDGSESLTEYGIPVLTLAGDLDGLTRITRIAEAYHEYQKLIAVDKSALFLKPVIVLPGVSHSSFCSILVSGDLPPYLNISLAQAQRNIAEVISSYMIVVSPNGTSSTLIQQALDSIKDHVSKTSPLVSGFLKLQATEKTNWCITAQFVMANLPNTDSLHVNQENYKDTPSFASSKPQANQDGNSLTIISPNYNDYAPNYFDVSTYPEAAQNLDCKLKSQEFIASALKTKPLGNSSCMEVNTEALNVAKAALTPEQQQRFSKFGYQVQVFPDKSYSTGFTWLLSSLEFARLPNNEAVFKVASPSLPTSLDAPFGVGGMHYCKLLSPARAIEWMLVDSLKRD